MDNISFYIFLFIHLTSLIMGFGAVMVIDMFGALFILKKAKLPLVVKVANITQRMIWAGWTLLVISGLNLLILKGYIDNLTKIKLFFVILLGLNGIYLHFIKKSIDKIGFEENISNLHKFRISFATFISQMGWWGALFIGFVHRHWRHNIPWPEDYVNIIGVTLIALALIWMIGETIFSASRNKKSPAPARYGTR